MENVAAGLGDGLAAVVPPQDIAVRKRSSATLKRAMTAD